MGRRVSRSIRRVVRRVSREVERVARRVGREVENVGRTAGSIVGSIPIVGELAGATGLIETPAMKAQKEAQKRIEEQTRREQQALEEARAQQQRIDEANKQISQDQAMISATQDKNRRTSIQSGSFANALSTTSTDGTINDSDPVKRLLKRTN